jgi:hypothetical protein
MVGWYRLGAGYSKGQDGINVTMDPEVPMTTQERAYTSPIWYIP